jgi:thiol-disulfide isomerase/thioredoxin
MPPANSTMLPLGTPCPAFDLPDYGVSGDGGNRAVSNADLSGAKASVIMFICNHCPFVKHVDDAMVALANEFEPRGVRFVAISSNNIETHPADAPDMMTEEAKSCGYPFPYLYDESQQVAHAFSAACTPDFFVFDADAKLAYRGQLDDSRPNSPTPPTGDDLRAALNALLDGDRPAADQKPSLGCGIKWKA